MTQGVPVWREQALRGAALIVVVLLGLLPWEGRAASLSPKDLLVLGRALAFMLPPPTSGTTIAVAYAANNPASRQDAEAIAASIGGGLQAGKAVLPAKLVEAGAIAAGGFRVVIAAVGTTNPQFAAAVQAAHTLCVTADVAAVHAALCTMAVATEPRVEIIVNHAASVAAGVEFASAFRMMIREI